MNIQTSLIVSTDLTEYFRQEVILAKTNLHVKTGELTEYYLVNLLCEFSRFDEKSAGPQPGSEPLAFLYKRATETDLAQKAVLLKKLGDVALYVAGFFTDSIEHSLVDVDYYIGMGGNAYNNLSSLVGYQKNGETLAQLYHQMSVQFTELVDVLNEISDKSLEKTSCHVDLLKVYDRWNRTGSERLRKILLEQGLLTASGGPVEYQQ